jgi:hypothetical protein
MRRKTKSGAAHELRRHMGGEAMPAPEQACDMQTLFCGTGFHQAFIIRSCVKTLFLSDIRIPFAFCWHGYC